MRLVTANAACMASSAPNPYGHQAPASAQAQQQSAGLQQQQQQQQIQNFAPLPGQLPAVTRHLQQNQFQLLADHDGGGDKPAESHMNYSPAGGPIKPQVHHSSASLINYDPAASYISGMASDSELTSSSTTTRHHHHRPYSSQSRVYHAHPVPRNSPASSSRLSHYSSTSAANVHSVSSQSSGHSAANPYSALLAAQQQQQQQQQMSMTPPGGPSKPPLGAVGPMSSLSHQSSIASSAGGSLSSASSYLASSLAQQQQHAGDSPAMSPISLQQAQQAQQPRAHHKTGGRQLPQRPFSQSMSIDQHSMLMNQQQQHQFQPASMVAGQVQQQQSPAHEHMGVAYHQQRSYPGGGAGPAFSPAAEARSLRLEMERVEMQAAGLSLYGDEQVGQHGSPADLPPAGPVRSASSSSSGTSGRQHHLFMAQQQQHQDPYAMHTQHHQRLPMASSASGDWMQPPVAAGHHLARHSDHHQFKQTMSIDHYPAGPGAQAARHPQQHHQRHFSPSRNMGQFAPADQYHSLGAYVGGPAGQQQQVGYEQSAGGQQQVAGGATYGTPPEQSFAASHHYPQQYHTAGGVSAGQEGQPRPEGRPKLQHQPSSSSSNSNLSGSLKSGGNLGEAASSSLERQRAELNFQAEQQSQQQHQKSAPSASSAPHQQHPPTGHHQQHHRHPPAGPQQFQQHQTHQSPQQQHAKLPPAQSHSASSNFSQAAHFGRQELLRRGYTSVTVSGSAGHSAVGGAAEAFGGSQSALSESGGDLSLSMLQTSLSSHTGRRLRAASPSAALEAAGSSSNPAPSSHHNYHASSSSAAHHHQAGHSSGGVGMRSESSTGLPNGSGGSSTLTKKSNSATQLSMTGTKKRLGFRKKQVTSFSVHRSEEVAPLDARHLVKQGSSVSEGDSSMSGDSSSRSWSNSNFKQQTSEELASMSFIDGLGKGQMISRQGLASPYLGDIQLSLCDRRGNLEIEVIMARNLQAKTNKILPLTYVKLYLVKNRKCLAKAKTTLSSKRTLNPLFQQQLTFHEDYRGCILQSIVWGNFGKMDKKNFMGIAQISIDDLELSDTVISWYKLFLPSSLQTLPSKSLRHTLLSNSTESFTTTNNS